jgi:hypothetical protein
LILIPWRLWLCMQTMGPMNTTWHKRCLVCLGCRKQLDSMAVVRDGNKAYCGSCSRKM